MSLQGAMKSGTAFVLTHEADPNRRGKSISLIALAVTRSLGRRGIPVVRIHPNSLDHSLRSRYCSEVVRAPDMYAAPAALVQHLLELAVRFEGKRVLFPASDDCAQFLGEHRQDLEAAYSICVARPDVMSLVMNKRHQYELAKDFGVPIPETYFPESISEVESLAQQISNYPYIIKPVVAHTWRLASMQGVSRGRKAVKVSTPEELLQAYRTMGSAGAETMLQEVIGGRDQQLYTFLGYFNRESVPLAYCVRSKLRQLPVDFGYCTATVSCHNDVVVSQSIRMLAGIGYSGVCGVEYKFDAVTNQYKLIEINARPVNTIALAPACGVDIPYIAYQDHVGNDVEAISDWRDGVMWYRLWVDFLAVRKLRGDGGPTFFSWLSSLRTEGVEAVYASDDIKPACGYFGEILSQELTARIPAIFPNRSRVIARS